MKTLRGALWFGLWKQHRLAIGGIFALLGALFLINGLILNTHFWIFIEPETGLPRSLQENPVFNTSLHAPIPAIEMALFALSFLLLFAVASFTEDRPGKETSGLCPRWFVLPFSTRQLVYEALLPGALGAIVCFALWNSLVLAPIGYAWPWLPTLTGIVAAGAGFQALFWSLPSFPRLRLAAIILYGTGFFAWLMRLKEKAPPSEEAGLYALGQLILFVLFTEVAVRGVALERRGFWAGHWWPARKFGAMGTRELFPARRGFPWFWTQFAQEVRAFTLWPVAGFFGVLALLTPKIEIISDTVENVFYPISMWSEYKEISHEFTVIFFALGLPLLACSLAGMRVARDVASRRYGLSPFTATRPVPVAALLWPKLLLATLLAVGITGTGYGFARVWRGGKPIVSLTLSLPDSLQSTGDDSVRLWRPDPRIPQTWPGGKATSLQGGVIVGVPIQGKGGPIHKSRMQLISNYAREIWALMAMPFGMVALVTLVALSLATLLWPLAFLGLWRGFPWSLINCSVMLILLSLLWRGFESAYHTPSLNSQCVAGIWLAWAVKFALAGGAFAVAMRRGLLTRQQVGVIALAWLVLAGGLHLAFRTTLPVLWQQALILLPLGRLPLSVLALNRARHRG